ncbi:MAG: hypothetical protein J5I81_03430 [Nitrococcus mobilis]|nr:hypothetical protein [Nitrococcus mobilis]
MATRAKAQAILGVTLSLPLLTVPMAAESTASNPPNRLTDNQLDAVTGGRNPIECLCGVDTSSWNDWERLRDRLVDRLPKWQPKPDDPWLVTTMALGEEGGGISPVFWKL